MKNTKTNHDDLINLLLKHSPNFTKFKGDYFSLQDLENLKKICFLNNYTLQLTIRGFKFFSGVFKCYPIDFPENYELRANDLIILDRECQLPYYIFYVNAHSRMRDRSFKPDVLYIFEKELALILKLCGCDLNMIENMSRDEIF